MVIEVFLSHGAEPPVVAENLKSAGSVCACTTIDALRKKRRAISR
jgi:hypothetical protein